MNRVLWSAPVDIAPDYSPEGVITAHYGSPVLTRANTIIVPVKIGQYDGFRVDARNGATGALLYTLPTDYSTVAAGTWIASFGPALSKDNKLFFPGAGGTVFVKKNADKPGEVPVRAVFYGGAKYPVERSVYDPNVKITTPLTVDAKGSAWFGFRTIGAVADETPIGPAELVSGIARVDSNGEGAWRSVKFLTGDVDAMRIQFQCAPALSDDESTVYFAIQRRNGGGYLIGIDAKTMKTKHRIRLVQPFGGGEAIIGSQSTASPTIGPDGDVYFGVLSNPEQSRNHRGYMLHFDKTLSEMKICGSFGWDTTASIIPASVFPEYKGKSSYFLLTKYNNYAGFGDGNNRVALLDPNAQYADENFVDTGLMDPVMMVGGPSPDPKHACPDFPNAVYEWCINAAAVDPAGRCALVNSEDGRLYRWDLAANRISEGVLLDGPRGQAYTPTIVGPTGIVYAINNAKLFAVGK